MATGNGGAGGVTTEINVTPMIDVLLVLLIIFMVIVPVTPRGESALTPEPSAKTSPRPNDDVVLEVLKGTGGSVSFRINRHVVARQDLSTSLGAIYANRAQRVLFVKGDDQLSFTQIAEAIDVGHAAGVDRIGLLTPGTQSGH